MQQRDGGHRMRLPGRPDGRGRGRGQWKWLDIDGDKKSVAQKLADETETILQSSSIKLLKK